MELVKHANALEAQGKPVIHLSIGEPDFPMPEPVQQALIKAVADNKTRYTAALGLPELREAISTYYRTAFQVTVPARQIVITSGASTALMYACLALINPGQEVMLADPGYPCNKTFVQMAGGIPRFVQTREENNFQPSWEELTREWKPHTAGVLLASPSNPTGTSIARAELEAIARSVRERGGVAHEALLLAVDLRLQVDLRRATDLAAETEFGVLRNVADARAAFAQRGRHGVRIVAQAGGDAQPRDDDAAHQKFSVEVNRPTRRSRAV